jgi:hypothetical protein
VGYGTAGLIASALAAIELQSRLRSPPTWHAWAWWVGRLVLEGLAGAAAYWVLQKTTDSDWVESFWGWILAGGAAPVVLRFRWITFGSGDNARPIGLASVYEPIRDMLERQIDDIGATDQAEWIQRRVLPRIQQMSPQDVAGWLRDYVFGLGRLNLSERAQETEFISNTLTETNSSEDDKRLAFIHRAIDLGAWRLVRRLVRHSRRRPRRD